MKVYFAHSRSHKNEVLDLYQKLKEGLKNVPVSLLSFPFDVRTDNLSDKKLMEKSFQEIDSSDLLLVDLSNKSIGAGIEAGYAKAKGVPVVYVIKRGLPIKRTMSGIASYIIEYNSPSDVIDWFKENYSSF